MRKHILKRGFTLVEMLVVISVFAVMGVILTYIISNSLRSSNKSESTTAVRDELNYAIDIIERQLRNAYEVIDYDSYSCLGSSQNGIYYKDGYGNTAWFKCMQYDSGTTYIASGSGDLSTPLTSEEVDISQQCEFICTQIEKKPDVPVNISVLLTGVDVAHTGIEGASVSVQTKVSLRNR